MKDRYLLDREGPPDPFVRYLERTLARKRYGATASIRRASHVACAAILLLGPAWLVKHGKATGEPGAWPAAPLGSESTRSSPGKAARPDPVSRSSHAAAAVIDADLDVELDEAPVDADARVETHATLDPIASDAAATAAAAKME